MINYTTTETKEVNGYLIRIEKKKSSENLSNGELQISFQSENRREQYLINEEICSMLESFEIGNYSYTLIDSLYLSNEEINEEIKKTIDFLMKSTLKKGGYKAYLKDFKSFNEKAKKIEAEKIEAEKKIKKLELKELTGSSLEEILTSFDDEYFKILDREFEVSENYDEYDNFSLSIDMKDWGPVDFTTEIYDLITYFADDFIQISE